MKLSLFTVGIIASLSAVVAAWSPLDQEIFRIRDQVELFEGPGVTFYEALGVKSSASQEEIHKAFRKKSRTLHPDKVKQQFIANKSTGKDKPKSKKPGVHVSKGPSQAEIDAASKVAQDRYATLTVVRDILTAEGRERYDHFMSNGFPKWKGTGYYYSRFRPGLGSVLTGLFIFVGGGGHWIALYMSWKRQQEFIGRYIKFARTQAWGDTLNIPGVDAIARTATPPAAEDSDANAQVLNRRQRRMQEKDAKKDKSDKKTKKDRSAKGTPAATPPSGATGPRKRVTAENGKILVVDAVGNVYLEQKDAEGQTHEFLLDPNEIAPPTIKDTALVRLPGWALNSVLGRFSKKKAAEDDESDFDDEDGAATPCTSSTEEFEVLEKEKTTAPNGTGKVIRRKKSTPRR